MDWKKEMCIFLIKFFNWVSKISRNYPFDTIQSVLWVVSQSLEVDFFQLHQRFQLLGKHSHVFADGFLSSCGQYRQFDQVALWNRFVVCVAWLQWHSTHFEYFRNSYFHASFAKHIATIHILEINSTSHFCEEFYDGGGASDVQTGTNESRSRSIAQFRLANIS